VSKQTETIDYDALEVQAREVREDDHGGASRTRGSSISAVAADCRGGWRYLFIDMAHIAGCRAGVHPSPIPHADFVRPRRTKRCAGARWAVFCKEKYAKEIDAQVFPGVQGGPLMHVIAAKAVALGEALQPEFRPTSSRWWNAKALCEGMKKNGFRIVSGTTENHVMLVDLQPKNLTGKEVSRCSTTPGSR